jgi:hypothetical protein
MNSGEYGEHRLFMLNFDPQAGKLTLGFGDQAAVALASAWTAHRGRMVSAGMPTPTKRSFRCGRATKNRRCTLTT